MIWKGDYIRYTALRIKVLILFALYFPSIAQKGRVMIFLGRRNWFPIRNFALPIGTFY